MELLQLNYFLVLAEVLHFGRAAKRLHISQPTLSIQLRKLEEELGVVLFHRSSRVVELTATGRFFQAEAQTILSCAGRALSRLHSLSEGMIGFLSIGFNEPAINTFLPGAVQRFKKEYPGIELVLSEIETCRQFEALRNDQIDLGFLRPFDLLSLNEFQHRLIYSENYLLALPDRHPLLELESIPVAALDRMDLLMTSRRVNPLLFDRILEIFRQAGASPRIHQEAENKFTLLALVRAGIGLALVPESCARHPPDDLRFRPLPVPLPSIDIFAIWKKDAAKKSIANFLAGLPA